MKSSSLGVIFLLFISIRGEYSVEISERRLSQGTLPCKEDGECQKRFGTKATCKGHFCFCKEGVGLTECSSNVAERMLPGMQARELVDGPAFLGTNCENDSDCIGPYSLCKGKQCVCKDNYIGTPDRKYCLKVAQSLGDFCEHDIQCTQRFSNVTCSGNKCKCQENYHLSVSECWKDVGFGEKCSDDRECHHIYGFCNETSNQCVCDTYKVINFKRTMCLDVAKNKGRCFEKVQCTEKLEAADCVNGFCHCLMNHHHVPSKQKCIPSRGLGQPCKEDDECYQTSRSDNKNYLICANSTVCACTTGFERLGYQCIEKNNDSSAVTLYTSSLLLISMLVFLLLQ